MKKNYISCKSVKPESRGGLLPVSTNFFRYISERVRDASAVYGDPEMRIELMRTIETYMREGVSPSDSAPCVLKLVFTLLRPEIDKAMARSASARARAKSRRGAGRSSSKPRKAGSKPVKARESKAEVGGEASDSPSSAGETAESAVSLPNRRQRRLMEQIHRRCNRSRLKPLEGKR